MRRRRFLGGLGVGLVAAAAGGLAAIQPRRSAVATASPDLPARVAPPRRVVVVGGGLAGMTAASELAARGFLVTLVEQGPELGGNLGGWRIRALGEEFPLEHGDWARRTGGSVVEVHAYAMTPEAAAGDVAGGLRAELRQLLPELAEARVLHEELQVRDDFTRWAPGDHAARPDTATPMANLFLAGDHVRLAAPAALMEAAVMSGRVAANAVLSREGVRQVSVPTVAPRGPLVLG